MPSEYDALFEAVGRPALFAFHGETVTHRPLGNSANDASVTAVFDEKEPVKNEERGRQVVRRAELQVDDSLSVARRDQWVVSGVLWQTLDVALPEGGMILVDLTRVEDETRTGPRSVL